MRVAKGEAPPRPFRSAVLPADVLETIGARLAELGPDPEAVRSFFDRLLSVEKDDFAGKLPDWAAERYKDRLKRLTKLTSKMREERLDALREAEIPGL
jgi:hypothetical protein